MLLDADVTQYVAIAGAALGLAGLGVGAGAGWRLRRLRRAYAGVARDVSAGDLLGAVSRTSDDVGSLRGEVAGMRVELSAAREDLADAIRHVAVVRYDAFDDMGGRLSFSAAMLDDSGDGLVFTSIHARSETRSYAKGIKAARCELPLSPEEEQAIGYAYRATPGQRGARRAGKQPSA